MSHNEYLGLQGLDSVMQLAEVEFDRPLQFLVAVRHYEHCKRDLGLVLPH